MATVAQLLSAVQTAALGATSAASHPIDAIALLARDDQRLPADTCNLYARVVEAEQVEVGSNLQVTVCTIDVLVAHRAANGGVAAHITTESETEELLDLVANPRLYGELAEARDTPAPEVSFEEALDVEGDVYSFSVRLEIALSEA